MFDLAPPASAGKPAFVMPHICDSPALDLDGDGQPERFEPVPHTQGTGGAVYSVYVGERKIGEIAGCWFKRGGKRRHGLFDISAVWRGGAAQTTTQSYRFDGRRYQPW